jgi:peptidoglycan/LPS O-acetylase OafA/YrhL
LTTTQPVSAGGEALAAPPAPGPGGATDTLPAPAGRVATAGDGGDAHRDAETGVPRADPTALPPVSLGYVAGFDGLRALGLLTILAYHHGYAAARGGIFTVSMFFTLSGFLIASLALVERSRTGRFSMSAFWERRARRLLPAAMVTVVLIVVLQAAAGVGSGERFKGDLLGALGYVANWRLAYSGGDYAAAFTLEAPVQHFWSLAVEEQFYLAFPLVFVGTLALFRGRWRRVGAVLGVAAGLSFVAAWLTASAHGNSGIAYYATYTRASEILVGVALAFAVHTRPASRFLAAPAGVRTARVAGVVGVVGLALLWHSVGLSDSFVFHGGTILNAGLTSLAILACVQPVPGLAAGFLGLWPLRSLGKISYGVYLFHWPLFLWLDSERTGLSGGTLFLVRVVLVIAVATASYFLVEAPFRTRGGTWSTRRLAGVLALPAVVTVALVMAVPVREPEVLDLASLDETADPLVLDGVVPEPRAAAGAPGTAAAGPARVLLVGDSVSWTMLGGFRTWNADHDRQVHIDHYLAIACTVAEAGPVRSLGRVEEPIQPCIDFRSGLGPALAGHDYDAIVVAMGHKDLSDRQIDGGGAWRHFGDPVFDDWWRAQAGELADILAVEGAPVLWATAPVPYITRPDDPTKGPEAYPDNEPARVDRLNALLAEVVADRPGMATVDVHGWLRAMPGGETDSGMRGDGVHWTVSGSDMLAAWLVPQLLAAVDGRLPSGAAPPPPSGTAAGAGGSGSPAGVSAAG